MTKKPVLVQRILRRGVVSSTLAVSVFGKANSEATVLNQRLHGTDELAELSDPSVLRPSRHIDLAEPLALPLAFGENQTWVVTTTTNRVGLLRAGDVVWWAPIETALVAVPAVIIATSVVFTLLRDGTLEIRRQSDGFVSHRRRLPLSDCASTALVSKLRDGTVAISCGQRFLRVDANGHCMTATTLAAHTRPTAILFELMVTTTGKWHRLNRWREPTPLHVADATPVMFANSPDSTTVRALLSDSHIVRFEPDASWSFEVPTKQDHAGSVIAIASMPNGAWLTLDSQGLIARHDASQIRVAGTIGPSPLTKPNAWDEQDRPILLGLTADRIVAGWPRGPVHLVGNTRISTLESSACSQRRQVSAMPHGDLVVACENGQIGVYSPRSPQNPADKEIRHWQQPAASLYSSSPLLGSIPSENSKS